MASPYTPVSISGYNASPPEDDGSAIASNQVTWAKHKDKLGDPLKLAIEMIDTNVAAAFTGIYGQQTAESLAGVVPSDYDWPAGHSLRYGADNTGATDATAALAQWCRVIENGLSRAWLGEGTYTVTKDTGLANYPGNDQPCLEIRSASGCHITGYGAKLQCNVHAQGILELQLCSNIKIEGVEFEGAGSFPGLDGTTGLGEKGDASSGYSTTATGIWGLYKNNSLDTSGRSDGGYSGAFPQDGGGTASTWGTWGGGYIGNVAYGLLIHNGCTNITVTHCKATQFNYCGFGVGHQGDYFPVDRSYADSSNINFENVIGEDNYSAGVHTMACEGAFIGRGSQLNSNGHPNALSTDDVMNPGYGWTNRLTSYSAGKGVIVDGVFANDNVRKGLDNHSGVRITMSNFHCERNGVCGVFSDWSSTSDADLESSRINIGPGHLEGNAFGPAAQGGVYINGPGSSGQHVTTTISNLTFKDSAFSGLRIRYSSGVTASGLAFTGSRSSASAAGSFIDVFPNTGAGATDEAVLISDFTIFDDDNELTRGVYVLGDYEDCVVSDGIIRMEGASAIAGVQLGTTTGVLVHDIEARLGAAGTPLVLNQSDRKHYNVNGYGGASTSALLPNTKEGAAPARSFSFRVDMDDLSISRRTATDIVGTSATSTSTGFTVTFTGLSSTNAEYTAAFTVASSGGLVNGGTSEPFIYLRAVSNTAIEVGLKTAATGSDLAGVDFTSGELDVTVYAV